MRTLIVLLLLMAAFAGCIGGEQDARTPLEHPDQPPVQGPWTHETERPVDEALARSGQWLDPIEVEQPPVHSTLLSDGRLLVWGVGHDDEETGTPFLAGFHNAESRVLDLSSDALVETTPSPSDGGATDLFCSDQNLVADGRVVAFGGTTWDPLPNDVIYGTNDVRAWDPASDTWTQLDPMAHDRWYPSSLILSDGRVLIAGGYSVPMDPSTNVETLEIFDPTTNQTTELPATANRNLPMYPRLYEVPSGPLAGQVLYQPAGCLWCPGGASEEEAGWSMTATFDPGSWSTPTHHGAEPMEEGRWFPSHVILPDGDILVTGGAKQDGVLLTGSDNAEPTAVLTTELFTPSEDGLSGTWETLAPMKIPRVYHSTSLLLPDGRVLMAGSVPATVQNPATGQPREKGIEIFEPPYLFRGERPLIEEAPALISWDEPFTIRTADADDVSELVLVRAGSVTHVYNPEQRLIELETQERGDGTITALAPPDAALAPPGSYMLFLLQETDLGPVPSVAAMVGLGPAPG